MSFPTDPAQNLYKLCVVPLFSKIDTAGSAHRVTPHKIEITLRKAKPGLKWTALKAPECHHSEAGPETVSSPVPIDTNDVRPEPKAPTYPTSSRTGPKNWDTLIGDEADDDKGDGPDAFFKMLYKNADPDTKRAMIKSYQESNGTSLSTQWSDVGSRKFETVPPDGLEAKKWEA